LQWFREHAGGPAQLYHEYGLGLEIVDSSVLLPAVLEVDDEVVASVVAQRPGRFLVRLRVRRSGADVVALRGKVTVALVREKDAPGRRSPPAELMPLVVAEIAPAGRELPAYRVVPGADVASVLAPAGGHNFLWPWRASYVYCHFSDRVQHSAYVRVLEEVVDRFLVDRGLSVGRVLRERGWIPVVSRARVRLLADAHMEETVHTTLVVEDVLKDTTYDARMDCYVRRGTALTRVATARILHGYVISRGERAGELARLDADMVSALTGARP
ncbi:MAG: thioesterase family protein, partial [Pseudonocardiaceae bacterium]